MADQTWSMGTGMTELQYIFGMLFEGKGIEPLPFAWTRAARGHMRPFLTLPFNGEASDYIPQWLPRLA